MDKTQIIEQLNEVYLNESFAWQPGAVFVHKMIKSNPLVDQRLNTLVERGILDSINEVFLVSFMHPDLEYCVSFVSKEIPRRGEAKVFFSLTDPDKLMINKRMPLSGLSFEAISKPKLETASFLSTGRPTEWKLLHSLDCHTISTTAPIPFPGGVFIWENFRSKLDPNKLGLSFIQIKKAKFWTLPQVVTKSNYLFQYKMIVK